MKKQLMTLCLILVCAVPAAHAAETTWSGQVKPVFDRQCAGCHGVDAPEYAAFKQDKDAWLKKGVGMRMDSYSHLLSFVGWPATGALMRRLDDGTGSKDNKPGNMYQHLGVTEVERQQNLAVFKAWIGSWNLKRLSEISAEELRAVKAKY